MTEEEQPDLQSLATTIIERLDALSAKSDVVTTELAKLTSKIRAAIANDDVVAQWTLLDEVKDFLAGSMETREEIRNVFHMFTLYVHVRNGWSDE